MAPRQRGDSGKKLEKMEITKGKEKRERDPKTEWSAGHPCKVDSLSSDSIGKMK